LNVTLVETRVPLLHAWFDRMSTLSADELARLPPRADDARVSSVGAHVGMDDQAARASAAVLLDVCRTDIERVGKALLERNKKTELFALAAALGAVAVDIPASF
jgi:hypothetical protein